MELNLKELLRARKMTQDALAEHLGVSQGTVSKWVRNHHFPQRDKLLALARLLKCQPSELFTPESFDPESAELFDVITQLSDESRRRLLHMARFELSQK